MRRRPHRTTPARAFALSASAALLLAACATRPLAPVPLSMPPDPQLAQSRAIGEVAVTATILTDDQARQHFGVDLGSHGLQAVWLSVRNASPFRFWFLKGALEPDFYSADEAASVLRDHAPSGTFERMRQEMRDQSMRLMLPSRTISDGARRLPHADRGHDLRPGERVPDGAAGPGQAAGPAPGRPGVVDRETETGWRTVAGRVARLVRFQP